MLLQLMSFNSLSFLCFSFATRQVLPTELYEPESSPGSKVPLILEKDSSVTQTTLIQINHVVTSGPMPPRDADPFLAQFESRCTSGKLLEPDVYPSLPSSRGSTLAPLSSAFLSHLVFTFRSSTGPLSASATQEYTEYPANAQETTRRYHHLQLRRWQYEQDITGQKQDGCNHGA